MWVGSRLCLLKIRQTSVSPRPTTGARKRYTVALGGPIAAPPGKDELPLNTASSFYPTVASTNANANIKESYTDSSAPAPLKRVGTPQSFSRVIGGSLTLSPLDDDDKKKDEEGDGEFGEGEETVGKSSGRTRMGACLLPQTQTRYHPVDLGVVITSPRP